MLFYSLVLFLIIAQWGIVIPQGQVPLDPGLLQPRQRVVNTLGGSYANNATLFFRNSPYRVTSDLIVEIGATLTIETGVQIYFDTGVGLKVKGAIWAVGNEFAHIEMLPYQQQLNYDNKMPDFRLIDGANVRQGRLQARFRDRWRSVCTMVTNWTSIDTTVACRSMGYSDGGFWKWYRRNNESYPFVLPKPSCHPGANNLWDCQGLADPDQIRMSENLCQGEDDLGILCWGPPIFQGWAKHWKGLQIFNSPFSYVNSDPDMVSVQKESASRLEYIDILYAGYDGSTKNMTSALWIEGVPPIMNGLRVERSARDGMYIYQPNGPIIIANSTFSFNRGHGIAIDNTTDGRAFINMTKIEGNWGDGVWYRQKTGTNLLNHGYRTRRDLQMYEEEIARMDMCVSHTVPQDKYFPHLVAVHLANGTLVDPTLPPTCWTTVSLPPRLPYTYSIQFVHVANRNPPTSRTSLVVCDSTDDFQACAIERMRIPIRDGIYPQSVSLKSSGIPMYISLDHELGEGGSGYVAGDVHLLFRIHASVMDKAFYGLNVTNSIITGNRGNGIQCSDIRERTALTNVTLSRNEGMAGFLVQSGAADIWVNDTRIISNWGDGMNVTFAGGSVTVNGTNIQNNRWRGAAFHFNDTAPFLAMHTEFIFKGKPSNNIFYLPTNISGNEWGGILIGNFCLPFGRKIEPKVLINWVELSYTKYHPALEIHSCQGGDTARAIVDITGNRIEGNSGMGVRISPAVNMHAVISSNHFVNNHDTTLFIKNAEQPWLWHLGSNVTISKNMFKFNTAKYIISIGLNEDAPGQRLIFNQQNEVRENRVTNPLPYLNPRTSPYAAMVVSSSNVLIRRNCFKNPLAQYEIATELAQHAKVIDAKENTWGTVDMKFMNKIFDQFYRYSLASIEVDPYSSLCNQRNTQFTMIQQYFRQFRNMENPNELGGTIYENNDLPPGRYTVTSDLHVVPGAKLTVAPGSVFEFQDGIGMLVQGELTRNEFFGPDAKVVFTAAPFEQHSIENVRLVDDDGSDKVTMGRLEVLIEGEWGTVCNRSWTATHARMACNQLGLIMDPEFFENWRIFPDKGDLKMRMDNVRCEENEDDITKCRHDGVRHNIAAGCRPTEVVGIRCSEPRWAGVRYSLLASPPTITGQTTMNNWVIEKAGCFDYKVPTFSPALQLDWNYHTFHNLEIKNNFYNGIDIVYNDLTKKPALRKSEITNNRRNGMKLRSAGITVEEVLIGGNGQAGVRYNPSVSAGLQQDIVSWLDIKEQPELEANNVFIIPNKTRTKIGVYESQLNQRKFLVAKITDDCPLVPFETCVQDIALEAIGYEYGLSSKMAIQIVNPVSNISDEDALFIDASGGKSYSARKDAIQFPIVSKSNKMVMRYTRSYGTPKMIVLVLFLDSQEYLDRFVHVYQSRIENNQYGVSAVHYSNLSFPDGTITNRWNNEKIWFQKVNFTGNSEAVIWIHSPQHAVVPNTPIAEITYHLDNCSIHDNSGSVIETHRDLFASANVFHWNIWSNTFANNSETGIAVRLPDVYDLTAKQQHSFRMTENRFENNENLRLLLDGYYCFANISSNNFTDNYARPDSGILELRGMEKHSVIERNRFFVNWGHWMIRMDITSQVLKPISPQTFIQYNYIQDNHFVKALTDWVDMWPRSYAIGVFGSQHAEVHYNRVKNIMMDFEMVSGCKYKTIYDKMNITYNWWGSSNQDAIAQRIFDFDDWNTYTLAEYSPFYTSNEHFIDFWWDFRGRQGQTANVTFRDPGVEDLKGRMYESKTLDLDFERWNNYPRYYKPFRPFRITRDLTIMPGATLTVQKGVEVHVWPNVRILVLGDLVVNGTYWEPVRFKPINVTEYNEQRGLIGTRYKRQAGFRLRNKRSDVSMRLMQWSRMKRASRSKLDPVYQQFPLLYRDDPYYQRFSVSLTSNGSVPGRAGFLQMYNSTTGETIPSCDRQFTVRNAQVVCRELGYPTMNAYHWITPRWDYNPFVIKNLKKTYVEPRECRGNEPSLDRCNLRLSGNDSKWMCMDNEHFNYIYCGSNVSLSEKYIGNWGGITFARADLELNRQDGPDSSYLRNVEIVGGGSGHNDSFQSAGLQVFFRAPMFDHLNVTNSSMHAIQIISPRAQVILQQLNVTHNKGIGIDIVTSNLQAPNNNGEPPISDINIPYASQGMLDMCSSARRVELTNRILVYYKYDSMPVDCVKIFHSMGRKIAFRFIQVNLYSSPTDLGRSDAVRVYSSETFNPSTLMAEYRTDYTATPLQQSVSSETLAVHLRATAADGKYGFVAEVSAIPSTPDTSPVSEIMILGSRVDNNDRGAIKYQNNGEISPNVIIEDCSLSDNGIYLYGNISTTMQAVELHLHNTLLFLFRGNSLVHNRGGLFVSAHSASAVARLSALVKDNLFSRNTNSTTLAFYGNNYQMITLLNNVIAHNYAWFHDTVLVNDMSINMTKNVLSSNTGSHTVNTKGYSRITSEAQSFLYNNFDDNLALGAGHQYQELFGYHPEGEYDEFIRRPKRQISQPVFTQDGVSFDWWTHVGLDTQRYRSTILAGSSNQHYEGNVFSNPRNSYELVTSKQTHDDNHIIRAERNYWGYPGTEGVASGKILDQTDYRYLIKVDYLPVLESNTSVIEGDCPPGWFQAGKEEFKSCFLYIGAAATYQNAVKYCEELDAMMPYLQANDRRKKELSSRIDHMTVEYVTDVERYSFQGGYQQSATRVWISSASIPPNQCGFLNVRRDEVGSMNCNKLLPFVCERVPRYLGKAHEPREKQILWVFTDASKQAIAACAYLQNEKTKEVSTLLSGKAKMTPKVKIPLEDTIPKFELTSILLGLEVAKNVIEALDLSNVNVYIVNDSTSALSWITLSKRLRKSCELIRDKILNAIKVIKTDYNNSTHFFHCASNLNIADIATRGVSPHELQHSDYVNGPNWLRDSVERLPIIPYVMKERETEPTIFVEELITNSAVLNSNPPNELRLDHFKSADRAKWVVAKILNVLKRKIEARRAVQNHVRPLGKLWSQLSTKHFPTKIDLMIAEKVIIIYEQSNLTTNCLSAKYHQQVAFEDEYGIKRFKSRIQNAELSYDNKNPIFLLNSSQYVKLVIQDSHQQLGHMGEEYMKMIMRQRFWIPRPTKTINSVIKRCLACKISNSLPFKAPNMPSLPVDRVVGKRAFENTGVDCLGPFCTVEQEKVYVCLFTCLVVRAVHLEVTNELSGAEFLKAFMRFTSRRGLPQIMRSDNGTNFVLAEKLIRAVHENDDNGMSAIQFSNNKGIKWIFNPPKAPFMGGVWERLVRTVKSSFYKSFGRKVLTLSDFHTSMIKIEAVVNSRPLTAISNDDMINPLRPCDFICPGANLVSPTFNHNLEDSDFEPDGLNNLSEAKDKISTIERLLDNFWIRFRKEYLITLRDQQRLRIKQGKCSRIKVPALNEIVLIENDMQPKYKWKLGKIIELVTSND